MEDFLVIAIDGGAASGKSSTSARVAEALNLMHVDTGSHYRAVAYACLQARISPDNEYDVADFLREAPLSTPVDGRSARIDINGLVPGPDELRSPGVNQAVSTFAALPAVRQYLYAYQREQVAVARGEGFAGLVMEGRDIGSVILPEADFRFFLEADAQTRARRRKAEGQTDAITERDKVDTTRKLAPLHCPEGATRIDTSRLTLEEVVNHILETIRPCA